MSIKNLIIKLLGGTPNHEVQYKLENAIANFEYLKNSYVRRDELDYCNSVLKRWAEYRSNINQLATEVLKSNPNYFEENKGLFFELVLNDYYFRRLYKIANKIDIYEDKHWGIIITKL